MNGNKAKSIIPIFRTVQPHGIVKLQVGNHALDDDTALISQPSKLLSCWHHPACDTLRRSSASRKCSHSTFGPSSLFAYVEPNGPNKPKGAIAPSCLAGQKGDGGGRTSSKGGDHGSNSTTQGLLTRQRAARKSGRVTALACSHSA